ncbi:FAD-binding oxidoreductase [Kribbella sp. CA-247076]|uniref:FAD-binding oxidoreductase n=1 Tax=Kribbella sp. CA-247076 TaxID=3239941 RepID=UPI003D91DCD1
MTQLAEAGFDELRGALTGTVIGPGEEGYDDARRLWNAQHDRRPAVIARVRTAEDVSAAVRFGVARGLEIAVRGGSHSMSGASSVDDGLMIDLSELNQVTVDVDARGPASVAVHCCAISTPRPRRTVSPYRPG